MSKVKKAVEKVINKLEKDIEDGKVQEGFDKAKQHIHSSFEDAERATMKAEDVTDGLLSSIEKARWSLLIVILSMSAAGYIGYLIGQL